MALLQCLLKDAGPEELLQVLAKRFKKKTETQELLERARELDCLSEDEGEEVDKLTTKEEAAKRAGHSLEETVKKLKEQA
eukprot:8033-Prorocentrum_lima.AAC.1